MDNPSVDYHQDIINRIKLMIDCNDCNDCNDKKYLDKKIYLVRHGETQWNIEKKAQGAEADIELNDKGKEQSKMTGNYLKKHGPFDMIFSSPQKRALETASIIKKQIDFKDDIIVLDDLREHKSGLISGTTKNERSTDSTFADLVRLQTEYQNIRDPIKRAKQQWKIDSEVVKLGGESYKNGVIRAKNVLNHILSTKYKKIIIVTHSGTISEMLFHITKYGDVASGSNCSIAYIEYQDGEFDVITMPNTAHLELDLK
jgi:probable phosphoglycerate mutase